MDLGNNLLCCESMDLGMRCASYLDPVLLKDNRILQKLLKAEEKYMPSPGYFTCIQTDVEPRMREIVAHWMLSVCQEEEREEEVFTLAMNLIDRFLSLVPLKRQQLQLLGTVCLLLASKLKESAPLEPVRLVQYGDGAFSLADLMGWEIVVLSRLKWDLAAVTPHAFLDQILDRLGLTFSEIHKNSVRDHASFFIKVCATDSRFTSYTPSMIAAAAVASAIHHLLPPQEYDSPAINQEPMDIESTHPASRPSCSTVKCRDSVNSYSSGMSTEYNSCDIDGAVGYSAMSATASCAPISSYNNREDTSHSDSQRKIFMENLIQRLHRITQIDVDCLRECHRQIEIWTENNSSSVTDINLSVTPTDVQDVVF